MIIKEFYVDDVKVSVVEIEVNNELVEVKFWGSYTSQLKDEEEFEAFIKSQAYRKLGDIVSAKSVLSAYAQGENNEQQETAEIDDRQTTYTVGLDNRNWAQKLIDEM